MLLVAIGQKDAQTLHLITVAFQILSLSSAFYFHTKAEREPQLVLICKFSDITSLCALSLTQNGCYSSERAVVIRLFHTYVFQKNNLRTSLRMGKD